MPPEIIVGKPLPEHAHYRSDAQARAFWRASYRVGRNYAAGVDENGDPVIVRHEVEEDNAYQRRLKLTRARNYAGPIVRQYNAFVSRKEPSLPDGWELDPVYSQLIDDVDGKGTPAHKWMRQQLLKAQIDMVCYILADTTADPGDIERTVAQAQEAGVRPIMRSIDADQVVDYAYEDGTLLWAIYRFKRGGEDMARLLTAKTYTDIWLDLENSGNAVVKAVGEELPHGYGRIPLVPLRPQFDDLGDDDGESQIAPLAYLQKDIANLISLEREELYNNTYTQWILSTNSPQAPATQEPGSAKGPSSGKITFGAKRLVVVPTGASVNRIGSDVAQADSIRTSIEADERALYRAAGISAADPLRGPGQVESGAAKAFRFNDLAANLAALADAVQDAWNGAMQVIYQGQDKAYIGDADYPDDFDMPDFMGELMTLADALSRPSLPRTIKDKVAQRFVDRNLVLNDEEAAALTIELEEAQMITQTPFPFNNAS